MAGIIILSVLFIAFVVVFVLYCVLIYLPIRWAKKRGITGRKRFYIGVASFVVVSALFFGKNLVSYTAFKYYCKNEAGLTVYKTLDQWKAENPGVWETLKYVNDLREYENNSNIESRWSYNNKSYKLTRDGNQRILWYLRDDYPFWGAVSRHETIVVDNETKLILAKYGWYQWTNTWDTSPDKDGWRGRSYLGSASCIPKWESFGYARNEE